VPRPNKIADWTGAPRASVIFVHGLGGHAKMPVGPKGEKRPRDANQLAKLIVDIATGQVEDREPTPEEQGKTAAAVARGAPGDIFMIHPRGG
jgi:hypothetical protein